MRKPLVCANWKLNHLLHETRSYLKHIKGDDVVSRIDVIVAPVAPVLFAACEEVGDSSVRIAAQNVFHERQGAFTGEWSVAHLQELGCAFAIVGHSERRQYFNESDESVGKKVKACFDGGLLPIACVGETLAQRENHEVNAVLQRQIDAVLAHLNAAQSARLVIAYEPVWAIGTGRTASAEDAEEAHALIRRRLAFHFGEDSASQTRILYGGSVKSENAEDLASQPNIDGALVGGASLKADSFLAICQAVLRARKHLLA